MPSMGTKPIPIMVTATTNTTGPQNPFIAQHMQQPMQAGNGPNAGGLGGQGSLAQYQNQQFSQQPNVLSPHGGFASITLQTHPIVALDPATKRWTATIYAYQNGEVFVLYDGPFPITKEGLLQHFATLTTEALSEE